MSGFEIIFIIAILVGFVSLFVYINSKFERLQSKETSPELMQVINLLQQTSQQDRKILHQRLDNTAKVIGDVQKNLGEIGEIGRSMRDLQEFLQSPKLRGNIGEQVLNELLSQMLPKQSFHLQYSFKSGEKVDAAIQTGAGMIPVDSKFPMENFRKMNKEGGTKYKKDFRRDVKKHIKNISQKYILTDEGTIDYALMYVPSEAVYYEVVNDAQLFDYASKNRVLPVSPTTFYAYLKAILMSLEGQKVEAKTREIMSAVRAIQSDYEKMEDNLSVLQKHLQNAYNMMGNVLVSFNKLGQKISSTKTLQSKN